MVLGIAKYTFLWSYFVLRLCRGQDELLFLLKMWRLTFLAGNRLLQNEELGVRKGTRAKKGLNHGDRGEGLACEDGF